MRQCLPRWVIVGCVLLVATTSVFAGAGKEAATGTGTPDVLNMVVRERWAGVTYDNYNTHYIEQKTNTKWNLTPVAAEELENKLNILLASGDRPDAIQYGGDDFELKYAQLGLLLPVNQYFNKAPNLAKYMADIAEVMKHQDGNIYALPTKGGSVDFITMYRKDWLDKLGLKVPTTIDEYYRVAVAVSNQDPDGNGRKDTYALGSNGFNDMRYYDHIFSAFGALPQTWMLVSGNIVNGSIQPGAKEGLRFLNRLFKEGALDPEFVTDNEDRTDQKLKRGVFGATNNYYFIFDTINTYGYFKAFKDSNPNGAWIEGPLLTSPGVKNLGQRVLPRRGWLKSSILKESKEIDATLRVFDWLASDEGTLFVNYGLEGEHYKVVDGAVVPTVPQDDYPKLGLSQIILLQNFLSRHFSPTFQRIEKLAASQGFPSPAEGLLTDEEGEYGTALRDFTRTSFMKMVVGEVPIDGGFETFVTEWNKRGGAEWTAALDKAYKARAAK